MAARDSRQMRAIWDLVLNKGSVIEPEDIEEATVKGPFVINRLAELDVAPVSCDDPYAQDDDLPQCLDPKNRWNASVDRDFQPHLHGIETRHTGTVGDMRLVDDIDRRVAQLADGISAAKARGDEATADALQEERVALRKMRDSYVNPMSGKLRLHYSELVEKQQKRCRMWIKRALQSLAKRLPKAAAPLSSAISRGTEFIYDENPGWEWHVIIPREPLPRFEPQANKTRSRSAA